MVSESTAFWVGIDVSKAKFDVALCPERDACLCWRKSKVATFTHDQKGTDQFLQWLAKQPGVCAGLCAESTGIYSQLLAMQIEASKHKPQELPALSIANPKRVRGAGDSEGVRDKCDEVDARVIALYGANNRPRPTNQRAAEWVHLHALVKMRHTHNEDLVRVKNRMESVLDPHCRKAVERDIKHLERQLTKIDAEIDKHIAATPAMARDLKLLESVPYIGRVVAIVILAEFGDLRAWSRCQLVAYAGLYPRKHTSGSSVSKKPRLVKGGRKKLRATLYMPSLRLIHHAAGYNSCVMRLYSEQMREPMCCIGAAMRKMLLVARAVVISGKPYNPALAA